MTKNYPQTGNAFGYEEKPFLRMKVQRFVKKGSSWKLVSEEPYKDVSGTFYANVIDAVPFFRNLGGYERLECGYTMHGYIPVISTSISPDRKEKVVRTFRSI